MAGIHGFGGLEPCPICHVPHNELCDCASARWPLRTGHETLNIVEQARKLKAADAEDLLKRNGLRLINVSTDYLLISMVINFYELLRMLLCHFPSQIHIKLYPGMECMLMTMDLEASIFGHLFKNISNNMDDMSHLWLIFSMFYFRLKSETILH
jgi:hypothetical protein